MVDAEMGEIVACLSLTKNPLYLEVEIEGVDNVNL
jgi:hypothetical protein